MRAWTSHQGVYFGVCVSVYGCVSWTDHRKLTYPARCFFDLSEMPSRDISLLNTTIPMSIFTYERRRRANVSSAVMQNCKNFILHIAAVHLNTTQWLYMKRVNISFKYKVADVCVSMDWRKLSLLSFAYFCFAASFSLGLYFYSEHFFSIHTFFFFYLFLTDLPPCEALCKIGF